MSLHSETERFPDFRINDLEILTKNQASEPYSYHKDVIDLFKFALPAKE